MQYAHAQSIDGTMLDKPKIINNNNNKALQQQSTVNIKMTILKQLGLNINMKMTILKQQSTAILILK